MPLDPEIQGFLKVSAAAGGPDRASMSVEQTREFMRGLNALGGPPPELPRVEDRQLRGDGVDVPARIYAPSGEDSLPVLLYAHGGRFFSGNLETHDTLCRSLAKESGRLIVAVDYRLAPEHKFPAAVTDCWNALCWVALHGAEIGGDPGRVGVGGDSAGANLAAVTAILARDAGGPALDCQMLIYPMIDATCSEPSHQLFASGYGPGSDDMTRGWREYLPEGVYEKDHRVSPVWAPNLGGLPPAFVLTAEYDSLRDEGEQYARAMEESGVAVTLARFEGAIHGIFQMGGVLQLGRRAVTEAAAFLRRG